MLQTVRTYTGKTDGASVVFRMILALALYMVPGVTYAYVGDYDGFVEIDPVVLDAGDRFRFKCRDVDVTAQRVEVGVHPKGKGKIDWDMELCDTVNDHVIVINVKRVELNKYDFDHDENIEISLYVDGDKLMCENLGHRLPMSRTPIYLRAQLNGNSIALWAGAKELYHVGSVNYSGFASGASVTSAHDITIDRHMSLHIPKRIIPKIYPDLQAVEEALSRCDDPRCHAWDFFDEEVETRIALKGGRYRLALLPSDSEGFNLIYMSGAEIEPGRWEPGMLKGRLIPTPFADTFTLYWIDSAGKDISDGTPYATIEGVVMTLVFPLQKAKFRFVTGRE